jgi:hypothetical protein
MAAHASIHEGISAVYSYDMSSNQAISFETCLSSSITAGSTWAAVGCDASDASQACLKSSSASVLWCHDDLS